MRAGDGPAEQRQCEQHSIHEDMRCLRGPSQDGGHVRGVIGKAATQAQGDPDTRANEYEQAELPVYPQQELPPFPILDGIAGE